MPCRKFAFPILAGILLLLTAAAVAAQAVYRGNVQTGIFHQQSCRYFSCNNCTAVFDSLEAALQAGFRPCKVCRP